VSVFDGKKFEQYDVLVIDLPLAQVEDQRRSLTG
jgi:hypothetical protein